MAWNPTYVQTDTGTLGGPGAPTYTKTFTSNVVAGNILVAAISMTVAVSTLTDSQGNVWTHQRTQAGTARNVAFYTAFAGSSGACTVTLVVTSGSATFKVFEWTPDGATAVTLDTSNGSNSNAVASHAAGSVTPSVNDTWALFLFGVTGGFFVNSGPTSYTLRGGTSVEPVVYERLMATPSTHNPTLATSTNESGAVQVIVLKAGGAAAPATAQTYAWGPL